MSEQLAYAENEVSQEYVEPMLEVEAGFAAAEDSGNAGYSTAMPVCPGNC